MISLQCLSKKCHMKNNNYKNFNYKDDYDEEDNFNYTPEELDDMYRDAFDGCPDAYWNID